MLPWIQETTIVSRIKNLPWHINTFLCPTSVAVIDECPIISKDAFEESDPVYVVLGDLVSTISFILINSSENLVVFGLPWFEHHNPEIDWKTWVIKES